MVIISLFCISLEARKFCMLKNNLILMPASELWEWSTDFHQQTAKELSKNNIVLCLLPTKIVTIRSMVSHKKLLYPLVKLNNNIYSYQPIFVLPFRRYKIIEKLNMAIERKLFSLTLLMLQLKNKSKKKVLWIFEPSFQYLCDFFNSDKNTTILYDCVDFWRAWPSLSHAISKNVEEWENELITKSHVMTVNSKSLFKIHKNKKKRITLVPQGFRLDTFEKSSYPKTIKLPQDKPIVGYIGGVNCRLDFALLDKLASKNSKFNFVLIGPVLGTETELKDVVDPGLSLLKSHNNIKLFKGIPREQIPSVISQFKVAMIPYIEDSEFNKYSYPMKLFEYFYLGKPVVSSRIDELKRFPQFVSCVSGVTNWSKEINKCMISNLSDKAKAIQKQLSIENSWEYKVKAISQEIIKYQNSQHGA